MKQIGTFRKTSNTSIRVIINDIPIVFNLWDGLDEKLSYDIWYPIYFIGYSDGSFVVIYHDSELNKIRYLSTANIKNSVLSLIKELGF